MSKFIVSNKKAIIDNCISKDYYSIAEQYRRDCLEAVVFQKKCVNHVNSFKTNDGGIFIVGTCLVDNVMQDEIPEFVFRTFKNKGATYIKENVKGMWSAVIWNNDNITVFNDFYGLYDVCYCSSDDRLIVATDLADIVCNIPDIEYDEYSLIMEWFQTGAFPGKTPFANICKLRSDELLTITPNGKIVIGKIAPSSRYKYTFKNRDEAIAHISSHLIHICQQIDAQLGPVYINMTGGLDSRLMFAAFNAAEAKFVCNHGVSRGTQKGDTDIVEEICKVYSKKLELQDWNQPSCFCLSDQIEVFKRVGFYNYLALGCKEHHDVFREFAERYGFMQSGYLCEALRLREWAEHKGPTFSLYDYIDTYYINTNLKKTYANYNSFRDYLIDEHKKQLKCLGVTDGYDKLDINIFERFRWIMSRFCDSRSLFAQNYLNYSFPIMAIPEVHEAVLSLDADIIRGGEFQVRLVHAIDPKLIRNFDVFSHIRAYRIVGFKKVRKVNMKNCADVVFSIVPFIKPALTKLYRKFRYGTPIISNPMLKDLEVMELSVPKYLNLKDSQCPLERVRAFGVGIHAIRNRHVLNRDA